MWLPISTKYLSDSKSYNKDSFENNCKCTQNSDLNLGGFSWIGVRPKLYNFLLDGSHQFLTLSKGLRINYWHMLRAPRVPVGVRVRDSTYYCQ